MNFTTDLLLASIPTPSGPALAGPTTNNVLTDTPLPEWGFASSQSYRERRIQDPEDVRAAIEAARAKRERRKARNLRNRGDR